MGKQYWRAGNMVYPVPAVMVSCKREGEKPNIITTAWCGTTVSNPAMVYVSIRPERYSYDIISDEALFISSALSVRFLVSVLRYLKNIENRTNKLVMLQTYSVLRGAFGEENKNTTS